MIVIYVSLVLAIVMGLWLYRDIYPDHIFAKCSTCKRWRKGKHLTTGVQQTHKWYQGLARTIVICKNDNECRKNKVIKMKAKVKIGGTIKPLPIEDLK